MLSTLALLAFLSYAVHLLAEPATCQETPPSIVTVTTSARSLSRSCLSSEQFANTASTDPTSTPRIAQAFITILTWPPESTNAVGLEETFDHAKADSSTLQARATSHPQNASIKTVSTFSTKTASTFSTLATRTASALLSSPGVAGVISSAASGPLVQQALSLPIKPNSVSDSRLNFPSMVSATVSNTISIYTGAGVFLYLMGVLMTVAVLVALL